MEPTSTGAGTLSALRGQDNPAEATGGNTASAAKGPTAPAALVPAVP